MSTVRETPASHMPSLPNDPLLERLLVAAGRTPTSQVVIDDAYGYEKTYLQLLGDVLRLRGLLQQHPAVSDQAGKHEPCYVGIVSKSGYEFLVAFFAIRSVGGAPILLASNIQPEEACHILSKANSSYICAGKTSVDKACAIASAAKISYPQLNITVLQTSCNAEPLRILDNVKIDSSTPPDAAKAGAVLVTSGTTGHPKMVVLPKHSFVYNEIAEPGSATISYRPTHWVGGCRCLLEAILTGAKLFTMKEGSSSYEIFEMLKAHRITHMNFSPIALRRLRSLLMVEMKKDPDMDYSSLFSKFTRIECGGSMVDASTQEFFSSLTGLPIEIFYSATELGAPVIRGVPRTQNSIGIPVPDVSVKLSDGSHGELCIRSSSMLIHYLGDAKKTQEAFDEEGYYKTGDLAELVDGEFVFRGRASSDFIKYRVKQIPALVVEHAILGLPYISEVCVLGIPHTVARELCAAIVRIRSDSDASLHNVDLAQIRKDLSEVLPDYMLPLLLRVLAEDETLPLTASGKPIKREISKTFFKTIDWWPLDDPPTNVEYWGDDSIVPESEAELHRSWDWHAGASAR